MQSTLVCELWDIHDFCLKELEITGWDTCGGHIAIEKFNHI